MSSAILRLGEDEKWQPAKLTGARTPQLSTSSITAHSPQKVDFTSRYNKRMRLNIDGRVLQMPPENFAVDPIHWWARRRVQFPNLSRLAQDILSIPGMF
jgi:hypothetical protein